MSNLRSEPELEPRVPGQQAEVVPASPLAVVALMTEVIRQRFRTMEPSVGSDLPWYWNENPTPAASELNDPDEPRKILIEPAYAVHSEVRNFRPAIYIDRQETVVQQAALDNFAGQHLPSGKRAFYAFAVIPITVEVVSAEAAESATLADLVWFYLLAGRELIAKTFGLHDVSNPVMGRTTPFEQDKQAWSTVVQLTITAHLRWSTLPISPLLNDVVLKYRDSGETNPDAYLLRHYVK